MSGTLYVAATPIGNLEDMTFRAVRILSAVAFIAAEDTRVTRKLLNRYEIKTPLVSYHEHNKAESGEKIVGRLLAGEDCALVSDAGMPAVSDPGYELVRLCAESGVETVVLPGACAAVSAVAISGVQSARFCFEGFLSTASRPRKERLKELAEERRAMVLYEAPHKLRATLDDLRSALGGDRRCAICRELTKLHEQCLRLTLGEACVYFGETAPKGEFVLVIEGRAAPTVRSGEESGDALGDAVRDAEALVRDGAPPTAAAKAAAARYGLAKGAVYRAITLGKKSDGSP